MIDERIAQRLCPIVDVPGVWQDPRTHLYYLEDETNNYYPTRFETLEVAVAARNTEQKRSSKQWAMDSLTYMGMATTINTLTRGIHVLNRTWWHDPATGQPIERNTGELLMLAVSELAEAMEGHRKSFPDDKLPHRSMFEVELADAVIRIFDLAGARGLDLGGAILEKLDYNMSREDHKPENRLKPGGKKY